MLIQKGYSKLIYRKLGTLGIQHRFLGRILGPLMKVFLPMINNVLTPLTNIILIPLGLLTASAADAKIHDKILE